MALSRSSQDIPIERSRSLVTNPAMIMVNQSSNATGSRSRKRALSCPTTSIAPFSNAKRVRLDVQPLVLHNKSTALAQEVREEKTISEEQNNCSKATELLPTANCTPSISPVASSSMLACPQTEPKSHAVPAATVTDVESTDSKQLISTNEHEDDVQAHRSHYNDSVEHSHGPEIIPDSEEDLSLPTSPPIVRRHLVRRFKTKVTGLSLDD